MEDSKRKSASMALIKSSRELNVYMAARRESQVISQRSRSFPPEERHALTDQIRRSSRAGGCQPGRPGGMPTA